MKCLFPGVWLSTEDERHVFGVSESRQPPSSFLSGLCGFPGLWVGRANSPGCACYLPVAQTRGAAAQARQL